MLEACCDDFLDPSFDRLVIHYPFIPRNSRSMVSIRILVTLQPSTLFSDNSSGSFLHYVVHQHHLFNYQLLLKFLFQRVG